MHYDVLFHVDTDGTALDMALTNIANYFAALPEEPYTVVLLVNGPAITLMVKDDAHAARLEELAAKGLDIRVCRNAMRHFDIAPDRLTPACRIVPAGVVEIVELQRQGFAYIRP